MSFQMVHRRTPGAKPLDGITVRVSGGGKARLGKNINLLIFAIGQPQIQKLGWAKGQKVCIEIGTNRHKEQIRLSRNKNGYTLFRTAPNAKALNLNSRILADGLARQACSIVHYRINGNTVTITMPEWWKAPSP